MLNVAVGASVEVGEAVGYVVGNLVGYFVAMADETMANTKAESKRK